MTTPTTTTMRTRQHHCIPGGNRLRLAFLFLEVLLIMMTIMTKEQVTAFVIPTQITATPPIGCYHQHPKPALPVSPPFPRSVPSVFAGYEPTKSAISGSSTSTQLYATPTSAAAIANLGGGIRRLASGVSAVVTARPYLPAVRFAALFLSAFFALWVASKTLNKHSIKFDGTSSCPLFQTTTTSSSSSSSSSSPPSPSLNATSTASGPPVRQGRQPSLWRRLVNVWSADWCLAFARALGRRPMIRLSDEKLISEIHNLEFIQTLALPTTDNGLIATTDGNRHAYLRRLISQAFCPQNALHEAVPTLQQVAHHSLEKRIACSGSDSSKSATVNVHAISVDCVLDTILCHYLGYQLSTATTTTQREGNDEDNGMDDFSILKEVLKDFTGVQEMNKKPRLPWQRWSSSYSYQQKLPDKQEALMARAFLKEKIKSQMIVLRERNTNKDSSTSSSSVLSQLIWARETTDYGVQTLTDEEIVDSMLDLIVAATDSTTRVLAEAMEWLGRNPHQYAKLVREQRQEGTKSSPQQPISYDMLNKDHAPVLGAIVEEVLSLHNNNYDLSPRLVTEEIELSNGRKIRKGWLLKLEKQQHHQHQQQMSTTTNENDNKDSSGDKQVEGTSSGGAPFGEGPRACLGQSLAILQLKVFLVALARSIDSYEVSVVGGRGSSRRGMDQVVPNSTNNTSRQAQGKLPPKEQAQDAAEGGEYTTTATASWMRDALETSPNSFA